MRLRHMLVDDIALRQGYIRIVAKSALLTLLCLWAPLAFAVPPGYDNSAPLQRITPPDSAPYGVFEQAAKVNAAALDTTYALCIQKIFQFAPFAGTDCWGWTDPADNVDYAFMGIDTGVVCVDATNLRVVDTVLGPTEGCGAARWRDFKNYGHYLYAVSECFGYREGLIVIDLQYLPDSLHFVTAFSGLSDVSCHNLSIDTVKGYAYLVNSTYTGFRIISLANPAIPSEVTTVGTPNLHDVFAHNDTCWAAEGSAHSFSVWNMASKASPELIARVQIPTNGYVHNIWPSGDRRHVGTTEETAGRTVKVWNTEDLQNILLAGEYVTPNGVAHNTHFVGDTMFISNYESGLRVVEISGDPAAPREIAGFDTWPTNNPEFNGCWGAYPFSANGYVYASNRDGKFYIFQPKTFLYADTIIADSGYGAPGSDVSVDVVLKNDFDVRRLIIPFSWAGPFGLTFDSATVAGLRTASFGSVQIVTYDPFNSQGSYELISSTNGSVPDLAPGKGPVLRLWFSIPPSASGSGNLVTLANISGAQPSVSNSCGVLSFPDTVAGAVVFCPPTCASCCDLAGDTDHDGGANIGDVTFTIAYIFAGGAAPFCNDEMDADGNNSRDIGDATYLIAYIFSAGSAPICGSTGI